MSANIEKTLETLVDKHSMRVVLDTLVAICHGKAEHLLANWRGWGTAQARDWSGFALKLDNVAGYLRPDCNPDGCKVPQPRQEPAREEGR